MSTIPAATAAANEATLSEALAAAHISDSPEASEKKLPEETDKESKKEELEEGEIQDDDGSPKTVFHDAQRFNVKVSTYPADWRIRRAR